MPGPTVFISYSHKDEAWKDRLASQLGVLARQGLLDVWDDRRISAGTGWHAEITQAMEAARVAVLLVSAGSLTSDFILDEEVPPLLRRRESEGLHVIPVIVRPCDWQAVGWLKAMNVRPRDGRALSAMTDAEADEAMAKLAAEVRGLLAEDPPVVKLAADKLRRKVWEPPKYPEDPYPVLLPYTHPDLLAGRGRELADLFKSLSKPIPILGLYAPSGAGKSSLLEAGLVPALRDEGTVVAFNRHPQEPQLGERLVRHLLEGPAGERPGIGDDPRRFVEHLAVARRLAGRPPLLVLDQFEDVFRSEGTGDAVARAEMGRAEMGVLLAATVAESSEGEEPLCRWLLAYREEFHGRVQSWLEDVLFDAKRLGVDVEKLPWDLSRPDRFHHWILPLLGAPPKGSDRIEDAREAFQAAVEVPLGLPGDGGAPRYPWRFVGDGAGRLAEAFAKLRLDRPGAPLAPELQVVLAHLLEEAETSRQADDEVLEIKVPDDPEQSVRSALKDHLLKHLPSAKGAKERTLLALRQLADAHGRRGEGLPKSRLAEAIGKGGEAILERLAGRRVRLIGVVEDAGDGEETTFALAHDSMAEVIVEVVDEEEAVGVDRELLRLRRLVSLNSELYRSGHERQATDLERRQYQQVEENAEALLWDPERRQWWEACRRRKREDDARRRRRWAVAAAAMAVMSLLVAVLLEMNARADLLSLVAEGDFEAAFRSVNKLAERGVDPSKIQDKLRDRNVLELVEKGPAEIGPDKLPAALFNVVDIVAPLREDDDIRLLAVMLWALHRAAANGDDELAAKARSLRDQLLQPLRQREPPPPVPEAGCPDGWVYVEGGPFKMGSEDGDEDEKPVRDLEISSFCKLDHEVTEEEFERLFPDHSTDGPVILGRPEPPDRSERPLGNYPVIGVSWYSAYVYTAWLGGRLPTEAEWEYAAKAGCKYPYCDEEHREITVDEAAWHRWSSGFGLHPICDEKKRNQFGLCDMFGNAWEWVADWYHDEYLPEPTTDPWGPPRGEERVIRGGSFSDTAVRARAADRDWVGPGFVVRNLGFRVVLHLPPS